MEQFILQILKRYKIELALGTLALLFLIWHILPEVLYMGWESLGLRTMMFSLFGIVGLMGLSMSIKRHEQVLKEHQELLEADTIKRMHDCVQHMSNDTPLPVFVGALHEIEGLFHKVGEENQEFISRIIAVFTQSALLPKTDTVGDAREKSEYNLKRKMQIERRNYAFKTLKRISGNKPVETIRKFHPYVQIIDFRNISFTREDMSLNGENLKNCDFNGSEFDNTGIINCQLDRSTRFSLRKFHKVQIDGTNFNDLYCTESFRSFIDKILDEGILDEGSRQIVHIYYCTDRPHNLCDNENEDKLLNIIHREA